MIKGKNVSIEEWKALYQAAKEFGEIRPWEWMTEDDLFGVQNPLTGEVGYCCIMGELGEVLAMAVYLGTEGLQGYLDIIEERVGPEDPDSMFAQDCLIVSFEDRDALEKEDKAFIRKLGLRFSGRRAWPLFKRYEPGYFPSSLILEDVRYLTLVLQQAKDVCLRLKDAEGLLAPPEEGLYLVRTSGDDKDKWQDTWMAPAAIKKAEGPVVIDELRLKKIKKIAKPSEAVWEVDFFYAPTPIEAERPYYPYAIMIAESDSGFIHDMQLSSKTEYSLTFPESFLSCLENKAIVPSEILVKKDEAVALLGPVITKLGTKLSKVGNLPAIDEARREMSKHFQGDAGMGPLSVDYCGDEIMEEYLVKAGSELSIYGLYGLLYGCHAGLQPVMPSGFLPAIFGEERPHFETKDEDSLMLENVLLLWDLIGQWDAETEDLMLPEFQYEADAEGAMYRIYDALSLVSSFLEGLDISAITFDELRSRMNEDAEALLTVTDSLNRCSELFEKEKRPDSKKIAEAIKTISNAEFIIAKSIANITVRLKSSRHGKSGQFSLGAAKGLTGFQPAEVKTGRNDPCPCGSGKKYKKCCGLMH